MPESQPRRSSGDGWVDTAVSYHKIDAVEIDDGALRLYRRRGLFGLLRRQDIYHPPGEWRSVLLNTNGSALVALPDRTNLA